MMTTTHLSLHERDGIINGSPTACKTESATHNAYVIISKPFNRCGRPRGGRTVTFNGEIRTEPWFESEALVIVSPKSDLVVVPEDQFILMSGKVTAWDEIATALDGPDLPIPPSTIDD